MSVRARQVGGYNAALRTLVEVGAKGEHLDLGIPPGAVEKHCVKARLSEEVNIAWYVPQRWWTSALRRSWIVA